MKVLLHVVAHSSQAGASGLMLSGLLDAVPELNMLANLEIAIPFNKDSCRVGPREWVQLARLLHRNRQAYDAFLVCAVPACFVWHTPALFNIVGSSRNAVPLYPNPM